MDILLNPWVVTIIGGIVVGLVLYFVFGIGKGKRSIPNNGGHGGNARVVGSNATAIGGKGGGGGPGGKGGDGGGGDVVGDNALVMGGEGGEAGQANRGGRGGRGPLHVLMEDHPEKFKEISEKFGITEEITKTIGKGGGAVGPLVK